MEFISQKICSVVATEKRAPTKDKSSTSQKDDK
jgi:hypothetical protein